MHVITHQRLSLSLPLSFTLSLSPSLALSLLPVINSYLPACESGRGSASAPSRPEQSPLDTGWKLMATTPANSTDRRPIRRLRSKSETPYLIEARLSSSMRTGKSTSIQPSCSQIFLLDVFFCPPFQMSLNDVGGVRRLRSKIRSCFYANDLPQYVWICRIVFWGCGI